MADQGCNEIRRAAAGILKRTFPHPLSQKNRRKNIARPGIRASLVRLRHAKATSVESFAKASDLSLFPFHTRNHDLRVQRDLAPQFFQKQIGKSLDVTLGHFCSITVRGIGQKAGLGQVWGQDLGMCGKRADALDECLGIGRIQNAVVTHNGVNEHQRGFSRFVGELGKALQNLLDRKDLRFAPQKSGIDCAKSHIQARKMLGHGVHILGQIPKMHSRKAPRVRGQESGGNRDDLISHHRQGGHHHRQGATPNGGKIVYCGNAPRR